MSFFMPPGPNVYDKKKSKKILNTTATRSISISKSSEINNNNSVLFQLHNKIPKFGTSSSISLYKDLIVQGDPGANNSIGTVTVFQDNGDGLWNHIAQLTIEDTEDTESPINFGEAVAIYKDSETSCTVLVGGPDDNSYVGATWVFVGTYNGSVWVFEQQDKLVGSGDGIMKQGQFVSLYKNTAAISGSGGEGVWIFIRIGTTWTEQTRIYNTNIPNINIIAQGFGISLYEDTLAFGVAPYKTDPNPRGAVLVYKRIGTTWVYQTLLTLENTFLFGQITALYSNTLVVCGMPQFTGNASMIVIYKLENGVWGPEPEKIFYGSGSGPISIYNETIAFNNNVTNVVNIIAKVNNEWKVIQSLNVSDANGQPLSIYNNTLVYFDSKYSASIYKR
jgi:hypothetical protein